MSSALQAADMDAPELLSTSGNEEVVPDTTTSEEKVVSESTSEKKEVVSEGAAVDEKVESKSSSGAGKDVAEIAPQEEEEEECGFCIFMKAGPCGERFKIWQSCVEGAEKLEKDIVEQCAQTTNLLKVCMEMNPQYYGPVLDAEKAMQADIESAEGTRTDGGQSPASPAEGEGAVASGNGDQIVEVVETVNVVVDDEGEVVEVVDVVEVEVKPATEGEGVVANGNGDQTSEAVEIVNEVVDDEGQVVEVDVVELEVGAG